MIVAHLVVHDGVYMHCHRVLGQDLKQNITLKGKSHGFNGLSFHCCIFIRKYNPIVWIWLLGFWGLNMKRGYFSSWKQILVPESDLYLDILRRFLLL